jgi:cyclopropane fatty-acyl-phospholipid synthase-like methyltransferase
LSLAGVIFSGLGFLYTYLQIRDFNSRIENYRDFYRWIEKLFQELERGKATEFYFYGPTILPGNVAMREEDASSEIGWFKRALKSLFDGNLSHVKRPVMIVPPLDRYEDSYRHFQRTVMNHFGKNRRPDEWKDYVEEKEEEARELQQELAAKSQGEIVTPWDERYGEIKGAYFLSNGKRIIFAKPLHYNSLPTSSDKLTQQTPHLVGFTTTDGMTIDAFREHFAELSHDRNRDHLLRMYTKHLITPRYLDKCALELSTWDVEALAEYDHDHFGKQNATDKFLNRFKIQAADRILDIGSGFGGPARYIATKTGCSVLGIELQFDRYKWAKETTERLESYKRVGKVEFCEADVSDKINHLTEKFDYVVAFLSILHLHHKEQFLQDLGKCVKAGGVVYIEDYVRGKANLGQAEEHDLREYIACPTLLSAKEYVMSLQAGGLEVEPPEDLTAEWLGLANERVAWFKQEKDVTLKRRKVNISAFSQAQAFNEKVVALFDGKVIKGVRIVAKKR